MFVQIYLRTSYVPILHTPVPIDALRFRGRRNGVSLLDSPHPSGVARRDRTTSASGRPDPSADPIQFFLSFFFWGLFLGLPKVDRLPIDFRPRLGSRLGSIWKQFSN